MKIEWSRGLASAALLMVACTPRLEEVNRVRSPDGQPDAATFNRQTDATVATPTEIYVLPADGMPGGDPVWRADKVTGMDIRWISENSIKLETSEARVFLSRDSVEVVPMGGGAKRKVTIVYQIGRSL